MSSTSELQFIETDAGQIYDLSLIHIWWRLHSQRWIRLS